MKGMIASVLAGIVLTALAQMSTAAPTPVFHCFQCKWVQSGGIICRVCAQTHSGFFNCSCPGGCCITPYTCTESGPGC
jgi:hypothetical protein